MNQLIFDFAAHDYPSFDKFLGTENAELVYVLRHKHGQFIYVWGEEGAGKSHLLQAWVAQALEAGKNAAYIDAASMPLTDAAFEAEYLAVDQVEKLGNEEQALLFPSSTASATAAKAFAARFGIHAPAACHPRRFADAYGVLPRLRSQTLNRPRKIDALASMAAARQVTVDSEIFEYLLKHWRRDMDSLMMMLDTLDNYAVTMGKRITLPLLRQLLKQQETQ